MRLLATILRSVGREARMLNAYGEQDTPSWLRRLGYEPARRSPVDGFLDHGPVAAVDLRSLATGSEVVFETRNSRYRVVVLGRGPTALVRGGRHLEQEATARVEGCTLGGSLLKLGWIALGFRLELMVCGKRIVTSSVRSIFVKKALY